MKTITKPVIYLDNSIFSDDEYKFEIYNKTNTLIHDNALDLSIFNLKDKNKDENKDKNKDKILDNIIELKYLTTYTTPITPVLESHTYPISDITLDSNNSIVISDSVTHLHNPIFKKSKKILMYTKINSRPNSSILDDIANEDIYIATNFEEVITLA